jgi:hypothetical protein
MNSKFYELVRTLEPAILDELRCAVAAEVSERRAQSGIPLEKIHPEMSAADKLEAMKEIARVLRGEE